ncbi:hypothetical protein Tco_1225723 [Tanacetum coccineum]
MNPITSQQAALDNSLITAEVLKIYMHQFWNTINNIGNTDAYNFKLDKKKCRVDTELGYSGNYEMLSTIRNDQMHQPLRTLAVVINRCISGKSTGLDRLKELRAQLLKEHMPYPRFTKVIIDHFISKDNTISMRNKINLHTARDDSLLGALKFVSKTEDCQKYGALILDGMINDDIKLSTAYKTYLDYATGKVPPKKARKFKKLASPKLKTVPASPKEPTQKGKRVKRPAKKATTTRITGVVIRDTPGKSVSKKKAPAKTDRGKGIELLSDASGSSEGADFKSEVPDEQTGKTKYISISEDENDDFNDEDDDGGNDDDIGNDDDGGNDAQDSEQTDSDDDENPSFTLKNYEKEEQDEKYVHTPEKDKSNDEEKMYKEKDDDVAKELYRDLNITQGHRDTNMTNAKQGGEDQQNASHESGFEQEEDDGHVTLTTVHDKTEGTMQSSSVSSNFISKLLNLDNTGPDVNQIASLMNTSTVPSPSPPVNPSSHLTTIPQQQTPDSTTTTTNPIMTLPEIPNFASLFQFDQRVSALETKMSEFNQTNQFDKVVSLILGIIDQYLASKMKEAVDVTVQVQSNKLKEEAEAENQELFNQVDSTIKAIIKEQVKAQVSKIMLQIEKYLTESLGAEVLVRSTDQPQTSYAAATSLGRDDQDKDEYPSARSDRGTKRIKSSKDVEPSKGSKSKESKSSSSSKGTQSQPKSLGKTKHVEKPEFEVANTEMQQDQGNESGHIDDQPDNEASPKHDWFQKPNKPLTPNRSWNKSKSVDFRPPRKWISTIAKARQPPRTFDELMGTPIDFSAYVMNRLKIDNLTQEILVGLAFNLLKGSCKSFAELKYHFEECYKAVNDRLDWHNLEGREYPFNLNKPLSLIEDRGRQVVPADYFINNDLEYLKGGSSSSKYATSTTRTKADKYDNIEGIEDMVPTLWSPVKVAYNKHVVWGTIIAVTSVKVMRWYDYGYLEEIVVRRDDNVLYKFKEGDFPRLNLCVALRMFTRRIVTLHRVEDLQRGVKSYQKKLNITRPETTRSNISKLTPYTAYKNPQGIIFQDKYKRNRLMRSDELYKFCDGTLSFVRSVLNDIASNLKMDYLPKRHWSNLEMKMSRIMVKEIDKLLFERRLMRNLEKFVGGRDYGNDLRLLKWTI